MDYTKQEYKSYFEKKSPDSTIIKDVIFAFLIGGTICTIGQVIYEIYINKLGLDEDTARTYLSMTMIFLGAILTGLNVYTKIAKYAGAGTIVPITGFANSIVSPAMEFKKEGLVLGLAAKMFVIAGPVLVYGISSSAAVAVIYWVLETFFG